MAAHDDESMAVDGDGRPLPFTPDQVKGIVREALQNGELLAAIMERNGDLMVQVFGPPSARLADVLEQAARGYRAALKGH